MRYLNLLPKTEKEALKLKWQTKRIYFLGGGLFLVFLLFIGQLWSLKVILFSQLQVLEKEVQDIYQGEELAQVVILEDQIKLFNDSLALIRKINQDKPIWSQVLIKLSQLLPPDTRLSRVQFSSETKSSISGWAKTRQDLLKLKENLEQSPEFSELEYPLSSLLQPENINFHFKFTLHP